MAAPTALTDLSSTLVADTSTVINVIATGCAEAILSALPNRVVVVDVVPSELDIGRARGHPHADRLRQLVDGAFIEIVSLGEHGMQVFENLVVGTAAETLDDGEAGTIAYAFEHSAVALIDERKAVRICAERYPALFTASTADVLLHPHVAKALGREPLADAVYCALRVGRMRVLPHYVDVVVTLIGPARAAECRSLPKRARSVPYEAAN